MNLLIASIVLCAAYSFGVIHTNLIDTRDLRDVPDGRRNHCVFAAILLIASVGALIALGIQRILR